ncbi:MAG: site-2 protease family protein [Acidimicrobiales bacterium]
MRGGTDWGQVLLLVGIIMPSIILHEVSHGWTALAFGDDTAKRAGRLTLNPVAHIDPFGTVLLPLLLAVSGVGVFGYAKPVPVNVRRLRDPRQHSLYVSLAGPATNLAIAGVAALLLRGSASVVFVGDQFLLRDDLGVEILFYAGFLNVLLAIFNLIPIPPLDGSALIERFMPARWLPSYYRVRQYSVLLLLGVFLLINRYGNVLLEPAVWLWRQYL